MTLTSARKEIKRIVWTEGLSRSGRKVALLELAYLLVVLFFSGWFGVTEHGGRGLLERVGSSPLVAWAVVAFVAYEAVARVADVVQDDEKEFDRAFKAVTYPIRIGFPVAALGFVIGDDLSGMPQGEVPVLTFATIAVCLVLFTGAAWRAGSDAARKKNSSLVAGGPEATVTVG